MPGPVRLPAVAVLTLLLAGCGGDTSPAALSPDPTLASSGPAALSFSGPSAFVEIPDAPSLDLRERWTLEAWIRPAAPGGTFQHVLSKWNGGGDASYTLEVHAGHLRVAIHDGISPSQALESLAELTPDTWQHVAATYQAGSLRLYIGGRLDRVAHGVIAPMNSTRPLSIGHEGPPFNGWQYAGAIDEVRVWRTARTERQLQETAARPLSGREAGLVGYWRFDEGGGQVARDRSASGNHGRLGATREPDASDPAWTLDVAIPGL